MWPKGWGSGPSPAWPSIPVGIAGCAPSAATVSSSRRPLTFCSGGTTTCGGLPECSFKCSRRNGARRGFETRLPGSPTRPQPPPHAGAPLACNKLGSSALAGRDALARLALRFLRLEGQLVSGVVLEDVPHIGRRLHSDLLGDDHLDVLEPP